MNARKLMMIATAAGCMTAAAPAAVLLSSYPVRQEGGGFELSATRWEAIGFRMGPEIAYDIDRVTLRLSSVTSGQIDVGIYANSRQSFQCGWSIEGGSSYCQFSAPGTLVGQLTSQTVSAKADYTFSAADVVRLDPGQLYWVVVKGVGSTTFKYYEHAFSDLPNPSGTGSGNPWAGLYRSETGASSFDFAISPGYPQVINGAVVYGTVGSSWSLHSGLDAVEIVRHVSAVPEPSSAALVALGYLCIAGLGRRKWRYDGTQVSGHTVTAPV